MPTAAQTEKLKIKNKNKNLTSLSMLIKKGYLQHKFRGQSLFYPFRVKP